uniref:VP3 n=1 Tax=Grass carp reovirus TaxID=128987 RepID=M1S2Z4_GCRV|nr:VP3 [Grass carp reovirus]
MHRHNRTRGEKRHEDPKDNDTEKETTTKTNTSKKETSTSNDDMVPVDSRNPNIDQTLVEISKEKAEAGDDTSIRPDESSENTKTCASASTAVSSDGGPKKHEASTGDPPVVNPKNIMPIAPPTVKPAPTGHVAKYLCKVCLLEFDSLDKLQYHQALAHSVVDAQSFTSTAVNEAIATFTKSWDGLRASTSSDNVAIIKEYVKSLSDEQPLLIVEDEGLSSSFILTEMVNSLPIVNEIIGYQWFDRSYDIPASLPTGAINRIVCVTGWAESVSHSRGCEVLMMPPTHLNVDTYRRILSAQTTNSQQWNPNVGRANVLIMLLRFVLANCRINKSTAFRNDATVMSTGRLLRSFKKDDLLLKAYPSRVLTDQVSKNNLFLRRQIADRIGRDMKAQVMMGMIAAYNDVYETSDTLTIYIRECYLLLLRQLHLPPTQLSIAISQCAHGFITFISASAANPMIICPWRATSEDRRLAAVFDIMRLIDSSSSMLPVLQELADALHASSLLKIDPEVIGQALRGVSESAVQNVSPVALITKLLRPTGNDFMAFWVTLASWAYNGICTTVIADDSFPAIGSNVVTIEALMQAMIVAIALPLTTDPNGPMKCFMLVANLLAADEIVEMGVRGLYQTTPAQAFNHPTLWSRAFIDPTTIDRHNSPWLYAWATLIHQFWPNPSQVNFGAPDILGSANLFTAPGVLHLPLDRRPPDMLAVRPTYDAEMFVWIKEVIGFFIQLTNQGFVTRTIGRPTLESTRGVLEQLRRVPSMTPAWLMGFFPEELAVLASVQKVQPIQIPYARTAINDIVTNLGVSRQDPIDRGDMLGNMAQTGTTIGVTIPVSAEALVVCLLDGVVDPDIVPTQHYARMYAALFEGNAMFASAQRAVVLREAYVCARDVISQCATTSFPARQDMQWIRQLNTYASTAAEICKEIDDDFKEAFDISGDLLSPIYNEYDPRVSRLGVAYRTYGGEVVSEVIEPGASAIDRAFGMVIETFQHEYNLFNYAKGDIILGRVVTTAIHNSLDPPPGYVFDATTPGVHVAGSRPLFQAHMGGRPAMLLDEHDIAQSLDGDWIMTLNTLQAGRAGFLTHMWPRIASGNTRVRVIIGAFPFVLNYHPLQEDYSAYELSTAWLETMTVGGVGPVPFALTIPSPYEGFTGIFHYYICATETNTNGMFSTNAAFPATRTGTGVPIDESRWGALIDPAYDPDLVQLPVKIDLYSKHRRYNYAYPGVAASGTMAGVE